MRGAWRWGIWLAALGAACAGEQASIAQGGTGPSPAIVYTCIDGYRFSARTGPDAARLSLPEKTVDLPAFPAASGARYGRGSFTYWSKGDEAFLTQSGKIHEACVGRPAKDAWEEARLLGIDVRGLGQEPGFTFEVDDGQWLRLIDAGGALRFAKAPKRSEDGGATRFRGKDRAGTIEAVVSPEPCKDASGEEFPLTLEVRTSGMIMHGCARRLETGSTQR